MYKLSLFFLESIYLLNCICEHIRIYICLLNLRPNSWTKLGQNFKEFSYLLFTVTSINGLYSPLPWAKVVWNWFVMYMETSSLKTLKTVLRNFNEIVSSWIHLLYSFEGNIRGKQRVAFGTIGETDSNRENRAEIRLQVSFSREMGGERREAPAYRSRDRIKVCKNSMQGCHNVF